jgi:UTP--glucose-1-phosphate uridylyltransferase
MGERNVIKKAIIPAAGYGTRGLPITKVIPKEMFPIGVKPAVHYIVEEAAASGIEQILMIVSRRKNLIVDYFDHSLELEAFLEKENKRHLIQDFSIPNVQIQYIRQPYAKGLGDAIRLGKSFVGNEPFAVLLPDDIMIGDTPALNQLIEQFLMIKRSIIGLNKV